MDEVMALAGVHHITIAPPLLRDLSSTEAAGYDSKIANVFDAAKGRQEPPPELLSFADNEAAFRSALKKNDDGKNEAKMTQVLSMKTFFQYPSGNVYDTDLLFLSIGDRNIS